MLVGKYLKKYYKKYITLILVGVLSLIAVDWIQLYIPELLGKIVDLFDDNYVYNEIIESVKIISLEVILISLGMFVGRVLFRVTLFRVSTGIGLGLRQEMFEKAERLDVEYFHNQKVGNIMSWITSDTEEIQEYFGWGTVMLVDGIFMSILCLIKMFRLDWAISLLILLPVLLIVVWAFFVENITSKVWLVAQKAFDGIYDFTQESFTGLRVIKAFVKEQHQLLQYSKVAKKSEKADANIGIVGHAFDIIIEIIVALITSIIIGLGGYFVYLTFTGKSAHLFGTTVTMDVSKLVVFSQYFTSLVWPLIALGQVITMHSRAKTSLKRISDFLDIPEVLEDSKKARDIGRVKGKIEFRDLSFAYPGKDFNYLHNISFTINAGETVGIVGRIGSGKTTIVSLLSRLYNVNPKSIFIDDNDMMDVKVKSWRKNIAVVPQENFLFSNTIEENIRFGIKGADYKKVKAAAQFSDVEKDIKKFPDKYKTLTGERGVSLSGGQKQRIAISRAFIKDAPIMIFDDSVSAVDIKTEETIIKNISELRKGKTTIVVASRVSTVINLDKIIVLDNGKLESFGTPKELEKKSPIFKRMVYLQQIENELEEGK